MSLPDVVDAEEAPVGQLGGAVTAARYYHAHQPPHEHQHGAPQERHATGTGYALLDLRDAYDKDLLYKFYEYVKLLGYGLHG